MRHADSAIRDTLLADGVPVAVVPLPTREHLLKGDDAGFQRCFASLDRPHDGLFVLDVTSALRAVPSAGRRGLTFPHDAHLSQSGHIAIANALCAELLGRGLVPQGAQPATASPRRTATPDLTLRLRWDHVGSSARILDASGAPRTNELDEADLSGALGCLGALPLAAVNECLESEGLLGAELAAIELVSPSTLEQFVALDLPRSHWALALAPWVRWHGAAEADIRALLRFRGPIRSTTEGRPPDEVSDRLRTSAQAADSPSDDEARWLQRHLEAEWPRRNTPAIHGRLQRLARRWERATRRARGAVSPSAAPGRRGRLRMLREP